MFDYQRRSASSEGEGYLALQLSKRYCEAYRGDLHGQDQERRGPHPEEYPQVLA